MPAKSRRGKHKRYQYNKQKNPPRQNPVATPAAAAAAQPAMPAAAVPVSKPAAAVAKDQMAQYAYIPSDLRRIGLLTAIIIVILFVLYFIMR